MISKIKISGGVMKTTSGYEFNISRISAAGPTAPAPNYRRAQLGRLVDDRFDESGAEVTASYPRPDGLDDYVLPPTAYAKIILTADDSLFPAQQRYTVTLQMSNFDFADLAAWPPLRQPSLYGKPISASGDSCSVSIGESWSLCETHSELGSETCGDWELVSVEAIGEELQQMSILHSDHAHTAQTARHEAETAAPILAQGRAPVRSTVSYADVVKTDAPNLTNQEMGHSQTPQRKPSDQKWEPVFQIKQVSPMDRAGLLMPYMLEGYYDYGFDDDLYDAAGYDDAKSFGASARTNMLVANVAYSKKKDLGVISVGSRYKSVK